MINPEWKSNYPELSRQLMILLILRNANESQSANNLYTRLQSTYGDKQISYATIRLQNEFDRDRKAEHDEKMNEAYLRAARQVHHTQHE